MPSASQKAASAVGVFQPLSMVSRCPACGRILLQCLLGYPLESVCFTPVMEKTLCKDFSALPSLDAFGTSVPDSFSRAA